MSRARRKVQPLEGNFWKKVFRETRYRRIRLQRLRIRLPAVEGVWDKVSNVFVWHFAVGAR